MSDNPEAAYIAIYGTDAEELEDELSEDVIGSLNERIHRDLAETHGVDVESVALVTGDRAEKLVAADTQG